ncbi:MAG: biotin--[acetyl-CoA-carboxylase] ligase [Clostridia bacterium]|nr:biotin--[acetyl-CoA-carboxylase] ligase [Clostridia bacterium]
MIKYDVLSRLKNETDFISGEKISEDFGVSRAAVNLAVKALRAEGYDIKSVTNRGYKLIKSPNVLNEGELMSYLSKERMGNVLCLEKVNSTNIYLKEIAAEGADAGQVVLADEQSAGRGRLGRRFLSPKGSGLYISYLMRPSVEAPESVSLTAHAAVAVARAIKTVCGADCGIKWVNDLTLNKKKICGILTELSVEAETGRIQNIVVGIGINVNEKKGSFPAEIKDIATSLYSETGKKVSRAHLAAEVIKELDVLAERNFKDMEAYLSDYRKMSVTIGKDIKVIKGDEVKAGKAVKINDDYTLKVEYDDGTKENLMAGEVSVRGLYDYT